MTTVKNIFDFINSFAPFSEQEEWDNSGFLAGDFRAEVKKCVVSLDCTKEVAALAEKEGADLIVTHHPLIFSPVRRLEKGSALYTAVQSNIAVISAHTNYDKALGGVNDVLCSVLGLKNTFRASGGCIVIGELENEITVKAFASEINALLNCNALRFTDVEKSIKKVAVCGGAGENEYIYEAQRLADAYVTGDMKYHEMLDAQQAGFPVFSAGHFETEMPAANALLAKLKSVFTDVEFINGSQTNPILGV